MAAGAVRRAGADAAAAGRKAADGAVAAAKAAVRAAVAVTVAGKAASAHSSLRRNSALPARAHPSSNRRRSAVNG